MRKEICKICNSEFDLIFNKTVLGVDYFYYKNCGFLGSVETQMIQRLKHTE